MLGDTVNLKTKAVREGDRYVLSVQKIWIPTAQVANKTLILARTTPIENVKRKTEGLSLFYTALDCKYVDVREIAKMGRSSVMSYLLKDCRCSVRPHWRGRARL